MKPPGARGGEGGAGGEYGGVGGSGGDGGRGGDGGGGDSLVHSEESTPTAAHVSGQTSATRVQTASAGVQV